jgi:DNA-binding transcriptional regulator LsrR (DeoR family)
LIPKIRELAADGVSKRQIAATLGISRTSVRRLRTQTKRSAT